VLPAAAASEVSGADVDLLFVGAPTQMRGLRLLAKPFLDGLVERGFAGTRAAAFDTRMDLGPQLLESTVISNQLVEAGCRLVAKPRASSSSGWKDHSRKARRRGRRAGHGRSFAPSGAAV
jgi:hypothetical protein